MRLSIAAAKPADAKLLAAMRAAVAREMAQRFGEGGWAAIPSEAAVLRQVRASHVLVARRDAEIVGTVRLATAKPGVFDSSAFTPVATALYVLGLAVSPQARGQGIGRALMDAAKESARATSADALWLDAYQHAAGAGPFYAKCGFREIGTTSHGGAPLIYYEWLAR